MTAYKTIAFQGRPGAYSNLACRTALPDLDPVPCYGFDGLIEAVRSGKADLGMLPCENSLHGRIHYIHRVLPESGLHIIGEHFQRVEHCLLGPKGARVSDVRRIHSQSEALGQVRGLIAELAAEEVAEADTAASAQIIAERGNPEDAAIASELAAEIYDLQVLRRNVEDEAHNTTRFYIVSKKPDFPPAGRNDTMTTLVFRLRSIPAALYKALGGFATNGVNITKLESYMLHGRFFSAQFLCDVEGYPEDEPMRNALEEMEYFTTSLKILGVYPAAKHRYESEGMSTHSGA